MTTGVSRGRMPMLASSTSPSSASSRSIQEWGKWLRIANDRSAIASREYREPMMRTASDALAGLQQLAPRDERAEDRVRESTASSS